MITFFTTGKPFTGHNGVIQRNALKSWTLAAPGAEVMLFGDEEGAAETARDLGIRHVAQVERAEMAGEANRCGPKILRSFFDAAQRMARYEVVCYANCDIVLLEDFCRAVRQLRESKKDFLMVGRRWDTEQREPIDFSEAGWQEKMRTRAEMQGKQLGGDWIDYFCFPRGLYLGQLPELVIGRVHWDQWLVWKALQMGAAVVDASNAVMAVHQNHDYTYHPAGKAGVWSDELAQRNYWLSGGRWHLRTIDDATQVLGPDGLEENPARRKRTLRRTLRTAKEAVWMTALDWTRPVRRAMGIGKI